METFLIGHANNGWWSHGKLQNHRHADLDRLKRRCLTTKATDRMDSPLKKCQISASLIHTHQKM